MATVTSYTAERMKEIEDSAIVGGIIDGDDLVLTRFDGTTIVAGDVRGPQGPIGTTGDTAIVVCTSGTRPALPFDGMVIYETDTDLFYYYDGSDWVYMGRVIICTSGTRPSSPWVGLSIYETDTNRSYTYSGSAWIYTSGTTICTAGTRPGSPFDGLHIYETDTKRNYTYNGTLWVPASGEMRCKVSRNSPQAVGSAVTSNIVWTTQEYDTDGIWTPGGTADSFIIPTNGVGLWRFILNIQFGVNASGIRFIGIMKNASGVPFCQFNALGNASWMVGSSVVGETVCGAGDVIEAIVYQSSGSVINVDNSYPLNFSAVFLGA